MRNSTYSRRRAFLRSTVLAAVAALVTGAVAGAAPFGTITPYTAGLNPGTSPAAIGAGPDGNLWVADRGTTPALARITPAGVITEFSTGLNAGSKPADIDMGDDGNLWFTDQGTTKAIGRITPNGTITEFTAGLNAGALPNGLTAGPDGNLWFADRGTTPAVGRITPDGTITEFPTGTGSSPRGIVDGPDGNLWFTDAGTTKSIARITPDGMTITRFTAGLNPGSSPRAIDQGPDGNLWFNDMGTTKALGRITTDGVITEFSAGLNTGSAPADLGPGTDGNVWFADRGATTAIGRITPAGVITEFPTGTGTSPHGVATGGDGNLWYGDDGAVKSISDFDIGAPAASVTPPAVTGGGGEGVAQQCAGATWSDWGGQQPVLDATDFDGYQWLLDGNPIPGQTSQSYTPLVTDIGHQLSCTVTVTYDLFATTVSATSAAVTVMDLTPPVLTVPAPIAVNATGPGGATATFAASATDNADANPVVTCTPASGTVFPAGVTTVNCTATDAAGNSTTGSFTVTVHGAADQLADLAAVLSGAGLQGPAAKDMHKRLDRATRDVGAPPAACKQLVRFTVDVFGELGKGDTSLGSDTADALLAAMTIQQVLGCLPAGSPFPQAAHDTVALIAAIDGLGQAGWVGDLRTMASSLGVELARGHLAGARQALAALDGAIVTDSLKPGRLTAGQAAQLHALVAAVVADLAP